jgi:hypothetical protein
MAEQRRRRDADQPVRPARPLEGVEQLVDHHAERDRDQRQVVVAGAHARQAEEEAERGGDDGRGDQAEPKAHPEKWSARSAET